MPTDRAGEPWSGLTYNGFAGSPAATSPYAQDPRPYAPQPTPAPRGSRRNGVFLGVGAALGLGLLVGVLARPDADGRREPVAAAPTTTAAPARSLPVEVGPETTAALAPADRLDVLPPDAERVVPPAPPPLPPLQAQAAPRISEAPMLRPAPGPPAVREAPAAPAAVEAPRAPVFAEANDAPAFNCNYARTRSEQMVCGDASLARLDRRLNAAFRTAVSAGVPYRELRGDQDDWLEIREDAANHSRSAVASIYRQRIRELEEMAMDARSGPRN
jgi:uncharacterized protein YecT (DUF1311 family)